MVLARRLRGSEERLQLPVLGALLVLDQPPLPGLGAALVEESVVAEEDPLPLEENINKITKLSVMVKSVIMSDL